MRLSYLLVPFVAAALSLSAACSDDTSTTSSSGGTSSGTGVTSAKFEADVMPVLLNSCALTACHGAKESPQGIHLTADKAQVYAELQGNSKKVPTVKLVVPGKPTASLLMAKMDGTQENLEGCGTSCGRDMPPPEDDDGNDLLPKAQRNIVRAWIANGAKND